MDSLSEDMANTYDYILSNPPYFNLGHGKLSPSEFKNRCRFFIDSNFKNLILGIANSLKPNGSAFVLFRDQPEHSFHVLEEILKIVPQHVTVIPIDVIRGTLLIRFKKKCEKRDTKRIAHNEIDPLDLSK
jgi:tRNA1Val (adenine37-N6)-methyltransferase